MATEYRTEEVKNSAGARVGWINQKYEDGVKVPSSMANPWTNHANAIGWTDYLNAAARCTDIYRAASEVEKDQIETLWLTDREAVIRIGREAVAAGNDRIAYAARYIFWDRFIRITGKQSATEFWAKFGAAQAAPSEPADGLEVCGRCNGTGVYRGAGYVENGVFKGYTGVCYRCKGRQRVTHAVNVAGERGRGQYAISQMMSDLDAN